MAIIQKEPFGSAQTVEDIRLQPFSRELWPGMSRVQIPGGDVMDFFPSPVMQCCEIDDRYIEYCYRAGRRDLVDMTVSFHIYSWKLFVCICYFRFFAFFRSSFLLLYDFPDSRRFYWPL